MAHRPEKIILSGKILSIMRGQYSVKELDLLHCRTVLIKKFSGST